MFSKTTKYAQTENKRKKVLTSHIEYDNTMYIMKTKFSISMDTDLLKEIDDLAKTENRTRSNLIEKLLWGILNTPTEEIMSATGSNK